MKPEVEFERDGYHCPTCGLACPDIRTLSDHEYDRHEPPKNAILLVHPAERTSV